MMFRGVSVLLDGWTADGGAMAHAGEWAGRLHLPLRKVAPPTPAAGDLFRPFELSVVGAGLPAPFRRTLLDRSLRTPRSAVLACPPAWRPLSRVLVLNQAGRPGGDFLDTVAGVCRTFGVAPIVLTVARTEAAARARERVAEEALAGRGLAADFDLLAGWGAAAAVIHAVRWRRCSHVFVERRPAPWWRRPGDDLFPELTRRADYLGLVAYTGLL